jgi:hypothetical protein
MFCRIRAHNKKIHQICWWIFLWGGMPRLFDDGVHTVESLLNGVVLEYKKEDDSMERNFFISKR